MPSRNIVKVYVAEAMYHVYNRGVEKRVIFMDTQDYVVFRHYLRAYLLAPDHPSQKKLPPSLQRTLRGYDLFQRVELLAYCLMPDHFHFILWQQDARGMSEFVKRLSNAYVAYFNRRYDRVGSLFQGAYKAVQIDAGEQALRLSRYIHREPSALLTGQGLGSLAEYPYSSYAEYLGVRQTDWLHPEVVLGGYPPARQDPPVISDYQQRVEDETIDESLELGDKTLE
jgi:putative transposase